MAVVSNLILEQGTTFSVTIGYNDANGDPVDLTGYTARSQMRKSYDSVSYVTLNANVSDAAGGEITLSLPSERTANIKYGRYLYDVEVVLNSNVITRIVEGIVTVMPEVTK